MKTDAPSPIKLPRDNAVKCSVSIPKSLLDAATKAAAAEGRSLSNYLQRLVRDDVGTAESKAASAN